MRPLEGKPLLQHTLERVRGLFFETPIVIVAPQFDEGNLDAIAQQIPHCKAQYSHDAAPLARMVAAIETLDADAFVLRLDGMHCFFQPEIVLALLRAAREQSLDLAKSPDNFPPQLTGEVWRAGALRTFAALLEQLPGERAAQHRVHPKFLGMRAESSLNTKYIDPPLIPDALLRNVRAALSSVMSEDRIEVTDKSIATGDQISFHYRMAVRHVVPQDDILDIACGEGFGSAMLAETARSVAGADIDPAKIATARKTFSRPNLRFATEDATATSFPDACFDLITSMETIEHVDNVNAYLGELHRILRPGGRAILSTPQNSIGHIPVTPAHIHEFGLEELQACCARYFTVEKTIGLKAGTIHFDDDPVGANTMVFLRKP